MPFGKVADFLGELLPASAKTNAKQRYRVARHTKRRRSQFYAYRGLVSLGHALSVGNSGGAGIETATDFPPAKLC
jgi:hypothetical protein